MIESAATGSISGSRWSCAIRRDSGSNLRTVAHPRDRRRTLADPKGNQCLYVSLDELEECIDHAIACYSGTPHAGLNRVALLEATKYSVRGRQPLLAWLPGQRRRTLWRMQSARHCWVRGHLGQGIRPHIDLYGVRYPGPVLTCSPKPIGRSLLVLSI